jgi:PKD repeat protein
MADRISSLDPGYETGDLSVYPEALDSKDTLYEVKNNAETALSQSLTFNGKFVLVDDTSAFPDKGLIRVGTELIYYNEKATGIFKDLKRGFAGSVQNQWNKGVAVKMTVEAETHNAVKDAVLNIEEYVGLQDNPDDESLHGILQAQEKRFLAPRPVFRGVPLKGPPALKVRFQNFSNKEAVRFLWDFGDGGVSTDVNPTHTYLAEGVFTVQLKMITSLGGQGVVTKSGYVTVDKDEKLPLMYVQPEMGTTATTFTLVDQTDGDIVTRHWIFDDGNKVTVEDPDIHTITHTYAMAGTYVPTLLVVFADQRIAKVELPRSIIVS